MRLSRAIDEKKLRLLVPIAFLFVLPQLVLGQVDETSPVIIAGPEVVEIAKSTATVEWVTDEASNSVVRYHIEGTDNILAVEDTVFVTAHSITLTELVENAAYFFTVQSTDSAGNVSALEDGHFRTMGEDDEHGLEIIEGPVALGVTNVQAVIFWLTNEIGDSFVRFRVHPDSLARAAGDTLWTEVTIDDMVLEHHVILTNLTAGMRYDYEVKSTDSSGNASEAEDDHFRTMGGADEHGPRIVEGPVALGVTDVQATIFWFTNELGDSFVRFRAHPESSAMMAGDTLWTEVTVDDMVLEHHVILTNLTAGMRYDYLVKSTDGSGNASEAEDGHFRTMGGADEHGPRIVEGPVARGVTDGRAMIGWETDEISDSHVSYWIDGDTVVTSLSDAEYTREHRITLTNLAADTEYRYEVQSFDPTGNGSEIKEDDFETEGGADDHGPRIVEGPGARGITDERAMIGWETDEISDSHVSYWIDGDTVVTSLSEAEYTREHRITLTNLAADTDYRYEVQSFDPTGNGSEIKEDDFETEGGADDHGPKIVEGPVARGITDERATIGWLTDEISDSRLSYWIEGDTVVISLSEAEYTREHRITLTNLVADTEYRYEVQSFDPTGNGSEIKDDDFETEGGADDHGPRIVEGPVARGVTDDRAMIGWVTDEISDSRLRYWIEGDTVVTSLSEAEYTREHRITLTNLVADTEYRYEVQSFDPTGNGSEIEEDDFETEGGADDHGPRIVMGPVARGITDDRAMIGWVTDEISDSRLRYWIDGDTVVTSLSEAEYTREHRITLTNLAADTEYRYEVQSFDPTGNGSEIKDDDFETEGGTDQHGPRITEGPIARGVTQDRATISWKTDEISNSHVRYRVRGDTNWSEITAPDLVGEHHIVLTNLLANTEYQYEVTSADPTGNFSESKDDHFKTASGADLHGPEIIEGPSAVALSGTTAKVEWETDELATSYIRYRPDTSAVFDELTLPELTEEHEIVLTGLIPDQDYYYEVMSEDGDGNPSEFEDGDFETLAGADTIAPQIVTGPYADDIKLDRATIEWETDDKSTSRLEYGLDTTYGSVEVDPELDDEHEIKLTNLLPDTLYHYRVGSVDASGNGPIYSADFTFNTRGEADNEEPEILYGPVATGITTNRAAIEWTTDEPSNSSVEYRLESDIEWLEERAAAYVVEHSIVLTNLVPDAEYVYQISSADADGNIEFEDGEDFRTLSAPDTLPPVITEGPSVEVTDTEAIFEWETDEISDSYVHFKVDTAADYSVIGEARLVDDHKVILTNLIPGLAYDFYLSSTDASGNMVSTAPTSSLGKGMGAVSSFAFDEKFQTLLEPDLSAPQILSGPTVIARTDDKVVIQWITDEPTDGYVAYGLDGTQLSEFKVNASDVVQHEIALTNLTPGQKYYYQVQSTDFSNNGPTISSIGIVTTNATVDTLAPSILADPEVLYVSDDRATIGWKTDEASDTFIRFGESSAYDLRRGDPSDVSDHVLMLSNLMPNTTYHYQVGSVDPSGNGPTISSDMSFKTAATADVTPPVITQNPAVAYLADTEAMITWETDELGDSFVEYGLSTSYGLSEYLTRDMRDHRVSLTNLAAGETYHYRVASTDPIGNGPSYSADQTFTTAALPDVDAPAVPSNLAGMLEDAAIVITWQPNTESDLAGYNIYRGVILDSNTGSLELIATLVTDTSYTDAVITGDGIYEYALTAVDISQAANESAKSASIQMGLSLANADDRQILPMAFALHQNYPNPFNPTTTIRFDMPQEQQVLLIVYDILGREIVRLVDEVKPAGYHELRWSGRDRVGRPIASGIYFARLVTPNYTKAMKMLLLK